MLGAGEARPKESDRRPPPLLRLRQVTPGRTLGWIGRDATPPHLEPLALPDPLRLPPPRQPTPEVRAGAAYRAFSSIFIVLLTVAILLFLAPFALPVRWHWPLWIAAGSVILLTAPLRAWGLRRGLLSYFVHGIAVEGSVVGVAPAGPSAWTLRVRYEAGGAAVEGEFRVVDAPEAPLREGDAVPVLHRPADPRDAVLPTFAGLLPY